eukprot:1196234-Prorocentrum_minimum.AAC.6
MKPFFGGGAVSIIQNPCTLHSGSEFAQNAERRTHDETPAGRFLPESNVACAKPSRECLSPSRLSFRLELRSERRGRGRRRKTGGTGRGRGGRTGPPWMGGRDLRLHFVGSNSDSFAERESALACSAPALSCLATEDSSPVVDSWGDLRHTSTCASRKGRGSGTLYTFPGRSKCVNVGTGSVTLVSELARFVELYARDARVSVRSLPYPL